MESHTVQSDLIGILNSFRYFTWRYFILCAVVFDRTSAQSPSVTVSHTMVRLRDGDTLELRCNAEYRFGAWFIWEHNRNSLSETITLTESERVSISVDNEIAPTFSILQISNLSPDDSGTITCAYSYPSGSGRMRATVSMDTSLCISGKPEPPFCTYDELNKDAFNITCGTNGSSLCFDDINLELRRNDEIVEGDQSVNNIERLATIPKNQITNGDYMCILRSELYPSMARNCTFNFDLQNPLATTTSIPLHDATSADATSKLTGDTSLSMTTTSKLRASMSSTIPPYELSSSASCDWSVYTPILFALISVISIIINVFFGIKQYRQTPNDLKSSSNNDKPAGTVHVIQGQDSHMELEPRVDAENKTYTSLKGETKGAAAAVGAEYEVPEHRDNISSMRNEDIDAPNQQKSSSNSNDPIGAIEGQDSYMELEKVGAENQAYTSLKRETKGAPAAVANYEVTLPDISSMRNDDIDTRNSEGPYVNEWRVGQFTSSNTKPAK